MLRPASGAMRMQANATAALAAAVHEHAVVARDVLRGLDAVEGRLAALVEMGEWQARTADRQAHVLEGLLQSTAPVPAPSDDRNNRYDQQTVEVMRRVLGPADHCIDVGAHVGDVLRHMVDLAPQGRHLAFEPLPHLAAALTLAFPGVDVHQLALSDGPGRATFHHVVTNPSYSGLVLRRLDRPDETVETIEVPMARLDDVVDADRTVRFVKIDVEGAEMGVLKGAAGMLERDRPFVIFEHGLGASDVYGTTPEEVHDYLTGMGFEVSLLDDWLAGRQSLDLHGFVEQYQTNENYYFLASPAGTLPQGPGSA